MKLFRRMRSQQPQDVGTDAEMLALYAAEERQRQRAERRMERVFGPFPMTRAEQAAVMREHAIAEAQRSGLGIPN